MQTGPHITSHSACSVIVADVHSSTLSIFQLSTPLDAVLYSMHYCPKPPHSPTCSHDAELMLLIETNGSKMSRRFHCLFSSNVFLHYIACNCDHEERDLARARVLLVYVASAPHKQIPSAIQVKQHPPPAYGRKIGHLFIALLSLLLHH